MNNHAITESAIMGNAAMTDADTDNGVRPYLVKHRTISAVLTMEEHDKFKAIAERQGMNRTALATQLLREKIESDGR